MILLSTQGHEPTAFSTMAQGINGQRSAFEDNSPCGTCGEFGAEKKCSACKSVSIGANFVSV